MKIKLLAQNRSERGPGMVYKNLRKGLELIGHEVSDYPIESIGEEDFLACLSDPAPWEIFGVKPESVALLGPNNWEIPNEQTANKYSNFVVPSQWVKDLYLTFDFMKGKNIYVWPVGIDTEDWPDKRTEEKIGDCLIYHKHMPNEMKTLAIELCLDMGLSCGALSYGHYEENALKEATSQCRFAILVTRTESQGIAVQQILSTGMPCFVFEKEKWDDRDDGISCPATAVPYWDDRCGVKVKEGASREEIHSAFTYFLENLDSFDPRSYVEENLTLEVCAQKFIDILESTNEKED